MAARWDGNSGKLNPFSAKREGKRMSPIIPKSETDSGGECPERGEYDPDSNTGTPIGRPRLYTPEQRYNYKSEWARYQKGLSLRPSKVETSGRNTIYYFHSCNSNTDYWEVTVSPGGATYIDAGRALIIVCPPIDGYELSQVQSDGETYVWEQVAGNRTVVFVNETSLNPTIFLANTCYTTGCDSGSSLPILLKVYPEGQPDLFDQLIIYNTPTSNYYFGSSIAAIGQTEIACRIPQVIFAPLYTQKAYTQGDVVTVTWNRPTCDSEFLVRYIWQVNTTGQYLDVDEFTSGEEPFFAVESNKHYRLVTKFNIYGKVTRNFSNTIYFSTDPNDNQELIFGDDSYVSGISVTGISGSYIKTDLKVTAYQFDDSYISGMSVAAIGGTYIKTDLKVTSYQFDDNYGSGLSVAGIGGTYVKTNLGRIVIG